MADDSEGFDDFMDDVVYEEEEEEKTTHHVESNISKVGKLAELLKQMTLKELEEAKKLLET